jgi:hypothetical protein
MGLKEYLAGIEDGSVKIEEVDFHKTWLEFGVVNVIMTDD